MVLIVAEKWKKKPELQKSFTDNVVWRLCAGKKRTQSTDSRDKRERKQNKTKDSNNLHRHTEHTAYMTVAHNMDTEKHRA